MNTQIHSTAQPYTETRHRLRLLEEYRALQKTFEQQRRSALARERMIALRVNEQPWNWLAL